jgi:hypothetical protein
MFSTDTAKQFCARFSAKPVVLNSSEQEMETVKAKARIYLYFRVTPIELTHTFVSKSLVDFLKKEMIQTKGIINLINTYRCIFCIIVNVFQTVHARWPDDSDVQYEPSN